MKQPASNIFSFFGVVGRLRAALLTAQMGVLLLIVPSAQLPATPSDPQTPDFRRGVLYGKVLDIVTGKPIADATVALQDAKGKVVVWCKTNAQGEYALAADPKTVLNLRPSRRRGLLEQVCRAVGNTAMAPVKAVASAVANPGKTVGSVAVSVASGTPAPLAAQLVAPALTNPKQTAGDVTKQAGGSAATVAVGQGAKGTIFSPERGQIVLTVSAPNYKTITGKSAAYWLEGPQPMARPPFGMQSWLETVRLAPAMSDKGSEIAQEALLLTDPQIEPSLVFAGIPIKIRVKLLTPNGPPHAVRLFARETRKNVVVELLPGTGANSNVYEATLQLDPKTPKGDTIITLAALRAEPIEVKLDKHKPDPLVEFVRRLEDMEASKPYGYDPRIMASENRLDVKITLLDPKQGTATPASTPSATNGTPAKKP